MAGATLDCYEVITALLLLTLVGGLPRAGFLGASLTLIDGKLGIQSAMSGTPAEKGGLQSGDVIVSVDGAPISDPPSFQMAIGRKRAGDTVVIGVRRGTETLEKNITLAAQPLEQQADYDIEYTNVAIGGVKRRVIITKPHGAEKHAAVLFIGGIGCYKLDGLLRPADPQQPYAKILHELTRSGYVTMRVEKSGMGDSEGPPCSDPRADFDTDVRYFAAGLAQLETYDFVDRRNVFIFAHSIGPLIAARIAAEHRVRGIIAAETIGTGWIEYDLTNMRRQLLLAGHSYDEVDAALRKHEVCDHRFFVDKQTPERLGKECAVEISAPAPYTYMQQVASLDLATLWKKIDAPLLLFYGTADFITDDYQAQYLRDMINSFHPGHATYVKIEGMDHGLQLYGTQKAAHEQATDAPFATQLLTETLRFLAANRGSS